MTGPSLRAGLALAAVFAAGLLTGMFVERHHGGASLHPDTAQESAAAMAELREHLELDDEQIEQIHRLLADNQQVVDRMWEQLRPEVQEAMRQVHFEIAELLRPEQRERFHEWLKQQQERARGPRH